MTSPPHASAGGASAAPSAHTVELLYAVAYDLHSHEQWEGAARFFRALVLGVPNDERGWLGLADCHRRLGQEELAAELLGAGMIAAHPSARCAFARHGVLVALGADEAAEALEQALELGEASDDDDVRALCRDAGRRAA
ncbi:MAG: hypothetical protein IT376_00510 [Polyangiaceae bacterium]|nr:hypothetical protein [Polyangiaceae bacterium]